MNDEQPAVTFPPFQSTSAVSKKKQSDCDVIVTLYKIHYFFYIIYYFITKLTTFFTKLKINF